MLAYFNALCTAQQAPYRKRRRYEAGAVLERHLLVDESVAERLGAFAVYYNGRERFVRVFWQCGRNI